MSRTGRKEGRMKRRKTYWKEEQNKGRDERIKRDTGRKEGRKQ
jgi:hypothetical protein